jgi:hypothetical protein
LHLVQLSTHFLERLHVRTLLGHNQFHNLNAYSYEGGRALLLDPMDSQRLRHTSLLTNKVFHIRISKYLHPTLSASRTDLGKLRTQINASCGNAAGWEL